MTDDAKALFLINAERTGRTGMMPNVIGLPLAGIESHVDTTAQNYAILLHDNDLTGHYQPSGNSSTDNPDQRISATVGAACKEFTTRAENLAYFAAYSGTPMGASSIPLPVERAIYNWIYNDASSSWGHREAVLLQDTPLSNPTQSWGFKNNNGSAAHEGFLGFYRIGSTDYTPFGTSPLPYSYGVAVVMNIFDPLSDTAATSNGCSYNVTLRTEDLPSVTANTPPIATDDSASTAYQTPVTISNVLANDSDPDGDTLSVTANTNPANGAVTRSGNSLTYTPNNGFSGADTFTYTVSDGKGGTSSATVTVTVAAATTNTPPTAADDSANTAYQTPVTISNVLANDSDPDGDTLSVTANTNPANGAVTRSGNSFTYTPNNGFSGADTFTYTISDGKGGASSATVTVTVAAAPAANTPPTAANDTASTAYQKSITISNVLANDSDPDGDTLSVTANTNPAKGTVTRSGNSFTYTPNNGFSGADTFTYTVSDGKGGTSSATVTVTVAAAPTPPTPPPTPPATTDDSYSTNQPPEAQDDILSTPYQTPIIISNVLENDSDTDGDTLRVLTKSLPTHGTITRFGDIFTYTPDEGFSGIDSFVYTIGDDNGHIAFATVRITVTPAGQTNTDDPTDQENNNGGSSSSENYAPSFLLKDAAVTVNAFVGLTRIQNWVISANDGEGGKQFPNGVGDTTADQIRFKVISNSNPDLFELAPWVDYQSHSLYVYPKLNAQGSAKIGITAIDKNGAGLTSEVQYFTIIVESKETASDSAETDPSIDSNPTPQSNQTAENNSAATSQSGGNSSGGGGSLGFPALSLLTGLLLAKRKTKQALRR
ncbi:Ig-like domain-containing protein [Candidatus Thiothrix sp. Deng01]|uniref:Ig-like domain-containing protein n=1 Tax=Candidatus Thiothrix phosphatis TaxID=3112415 RepID=A0ABU6CWU4_9GAMM|nr:Ig-like domain-containing protein [Candidatus Thiothrix sp. Deng01]MEB4591017.1 Ig-like domain-containing protein [Candidatus Thiothrix sp. Deng01]